MDAAPIQPRMRSTIPGGEERSVDRYNNVCLDSAIGYITPKDMLAGRQADIHAARNRKLEEAQKQCQVRRQKAV